MKMKNQLCLLFKILFLLTIPWRSAFTQEKERAFYEVEFEQKMRLQSLLLENDLKTTSNQLKFDILYYGLNLAIQPKSEWLTGSVKVRAKILETDLTNMEIDLGTHLQVDSVKSNGERLLFVHQFDLIDISLDQKYLRNEVVTLEIFYKGNPAIRARDAFVFSYFQRNPWIWTISEPFDARLWWPCKDTPSDKADSVDITVTVPENLIVASNGKLVATETNNGLKTYFWQVRYPIATYLVSLAIHSYLTDVAWFKYSAADSMEVHSYVLPSHPEVIQTSTKTTLEALRIFSEIFGPYPYLKEKYGHAEFGWSGGMEHQTLTSLGGWSTRLIVHELAHQWWGDMVTCRDFHHIWLNEGFATYSEALYWESLAGREAYFNDMFSKIYFGSGSIYVPDLTNRSRIFSYNLTYQKSAWVLHMLRHVVGDSTFFKILKTYYADPGFQYGTVVTEEFRDLCEAVSGQDLDWYFQEWIYGEYHPVYFAKWRVLRSIGMQCSVELTIQQQPRENFLFKMPVDIRFLSKTGDTTIVVWDSLLVQNFNIDLKLHPNKVVLDPDGWILKEVDHQEPYGDRHFLQQNYPNPFRIANARQTAAISVTMISYQINQTSQVKLTIYNLLGQKVRELMNALQIPKFYSTRWDGRNDAGELVASGVYFYVLDTDSYFESRKMLVLR